MSITKRLLVWSLLIIFGQPLFSQVFSVDGDLRNRFEYRAGYKKPASDLTDPTSIIFQRGRIAFSFKTDSFQVQLSFQDARIWGQNGSTSEANVALVHESWFRYWASPTLSFKIGRQEISYDDQRIVGAPDWSPSGKSYDAGLVVWESPEKGVIANLGGGLNRSKDDLVLSDYTPDYFRFFTVGYLKKSIGTSSSISLLSFTEGNQKKGAASIIYPRHTVGSNTILSKDALSADISAYLQHGQNEAGSTLLAGAFALKGTYKMNSAGSVYLGGAYYTGTSRTQVLKGKTNSFIRPYGTAHTLHGFMDYYTKLKEMKEGGLVDLFVGYKCNLSAKWGAQLDYHYFALAESGFADAAAPQGYNHVGNKELGSELDFVLSYQLAKSFMIQGGYSIMLQTATAEKLLVVTNGKTSQWAFFSLTFKPRLFDRKL